jgi:hypothetical protein
MVINKNTVNKVIFTLAEKTTLDPVYYLFELTNLADKSVITFTTTDISANKYRYNEFEIEDTTSENHLLGKVDFELEGDYTYNIYEQSSSTNLEVLNAGGLVESGRIRVIGTATEIPTFTTSQNIKVFNG